MTKPTICFVDADSICYAAGHCEHPEQMEMTADAYIKDISEATQADKLVGFIENPACKANFRNHIAVTRPYKGNRAHKQKPPYMVDAKRYLKSKYGFNFVTYMESEDACAISAHANGMENSYIACIDKDLHQFAGRFYDYRRKAWLVLDQPQAAYNLYAQVLTGDSVDHIPGIPGCGPKKAEGYLSVASSFVDYPELTAKAYKSHELSYEYFLEQARLIYILRQRGEVFTPVSRETWETL